MTSPPLDRQGLFAAISAFVLWGLFPLYWYFLRAVPALEIIAHRVVWCALFVVGYLLLREGPGWLRHALSGARVLPMLVASSLLIGFNWGIYIWAVTNERVVDASLGYFINPLVNVVLGVLLLHERLNRAQWTAVAIATVGVLWLAFIYGEPPWIALALAGSFGLYGLIRKVAAVEAVSGLAVENLILLLPSLALLGWAHGGDGGAFARGDIRVDVLLIVGGALTALPLIGFAYGARRLPYSLVGILQYIAPTLQLGCGVLVLGETFGAMQAVGFACIWTALAVYAVDGWRGAQRAAKRRREPHIDQHVPACDGAAPPLEPAPAYAAAPSSEASQSSSEPSLTPSNRNVER